MDSKELEFSTQLDYGQGKRRQGLDGRKVLSPVERGPEGGHSLKVVLRSEALLSTVLTFITVRDREGRNSLMATELRKK